jgi:hypothetical protein
MGSEGSAPAAVGQGEDFVSLMRRCEVPTSMRLMIRQTEMDRQGSEHLSSKLTRDRSRLVHTEDGVRGAHGHPARQV